MFVDICGMLFFYLILIFKKHLLIICLYFLNHNMDSEQHLKVKCKYCSL